MPKKTITMNGKKIVKKPITEIKTITDFFSEFKTEYVAFVNWFIKDDNTKQCMVEFVEDKPKKYINKWNRDQWKILVLDDTDCERILSGGKRLFRTIMNYCTRSEKLPTQLGKIIIFRKGTGFDTYYSIQDDNK